MSKPPLGNDLIGLFRGLSRIGSAAAEIRSQEVAKAWATSSLRPVITKGASSLQETITNALQDPQLAQANVSKSATEAFSRISLVAEGIKAYRTQTAPPFSTEGVSETVEEPYNPLYDPNVQELSIEDLMLVEAMSGHEDHVPQQGLKSSADILASIGEITDAAAANVGEVKSEISKRLEGFEPLLDASQYKESEITEEHVQALDLKLQEMEGAAYGYNVGAMKDLDYGEPAEEVPGDSLGKVEPSVKASAEMSAAVVEESCVDPLIHESNIQELSIEDVVMQEALSSPENLTVESDTILESSNTARSVKDENADAEMKSIAAQRVEQFDNLIESLKFEEKEVTQEHLQAVSEKLTEIQSIAFGHDLRIFSELEKVKEKEDSLEKREDYSSNKCAAAGEASEPSNEPKILEADSLKKEVSDIENTTVSIETIEEEPTKILSEKENAELELDNTLAQVAKSVDISTSEKTVREFDVAVPIEPSVDVKGVDPDIKPPNPQPGVTGSGVESSLNVSSPSAVLMGAGVTMASVTAAATAVPGLGVAATAAVLSGGVMAAAKYQEKESISHLKGETEGKDGQKQEEIIEEASQDTTSDKIGSTLVEVEFITEPVKGKEESSTSENVEHSSALDHDTSTAVESETAKDTSEVSAEESTESLKAISSETEKSSVTVAEASTEHVSDSGKAALEMVDSRASSEISSKESESVIAGESSSEAISSETEKSSVSITEASSEHVSESDKVAPEMEDSSASSQISSKQSESVVDSSVDSGSSHNKETTVESVSESHSSTVVTAQETPAMSFGIKDEVKCEDILSPSISKVVKDKEHVQTEPIEILIPVSETIDASADVKAASAESQKETIEIVSTDLESKSSLESSAPVPEVLIETVDSKSLQTGDSAEPVSEVVVSTVGVKSVSTDQEPETHVDTSSSSSEPILEKYTIVNATESTVTETIKPASETVTSSSDNTLAAKSIESLSAESMKTLEADVSTTSTVESSPATEERKEKAAEESYINSDNLASTATASATVAAAVAATATASASANAVDAAPSTSTPVSKTVPVEPVSKPVSAAKPKPKPKLLGKKPLAKDKPKSTLAENAQARKVPHSRFGRMLTFGSLAAGLGAGTIAEMTRRTLGVNDGKGSGSLLDASPFLTEANAKRIVDTLCKVRGAALKLGQMLSIQDSALINPQIQKIFERVRQSADFMPSWQLERAIEEQLGNEWKSKIAFMDERPFAAASIGQVHLVKLHDGRSAAMKIQYPGVAAGIESDINNLISTLKVANILPEGLYVDSVIEVAKKELGWECDYVREAACTEKYRKLVLPYSEFYVPEIVPELCTSQIFTSELIDGVAVDKCVDMDQDTRNFIGEKILRLCLLELFRFGFMQTDPNWSNFFYNADTEQLALLDFGACRSYDKSFVDKYIHIIHGAAVKDREKVIKYSQELGFLTGYEAKVMVDAHVDAIMILGEAFQEDKPFYFGSQDTTHRIQHLVPVMLSHRMCAPPEESYSLHRKMSGVFLLCAKLNAAVRCKPLFEEVFNTYKFGGTWEEFHASLNS